MTLAKAIEIGLKLRVELERDGYLNEEETDAFHALIASARSVAASKRKPCADDCNWGARNRSL